MIYSQSNINNIKNTVLKYHSITKYFSTLNHQIFCINTQIILPPSNAGIGSMLNIAKANEIIPANARYKTRRPLDKSISPNFTTPTGPVREPRDFFILDQLKDIKLLHNLHNAAKVKSN